MTLKPDLCVLLAAVQKGVDENDVVAMQLGASDAKSLTEKQQFYLDKIKAKLAKVLHHALFLQSLAQMLNSSSNFCGCMIEIYTQAPAQRMSHIEQNFCAGSRRRKEAEGPQQRKV